MWLLEGSHYLYPERAYLMLGIPCIAILFWLLAQRRANSIQLFFGEDLSSQLSESRSPLLMGLKTALLCLAWMMTTLALMYPYTQVLPTPKTSTQQERQQRPAHNVILLIDASASMNVVDGRSGESRLTSAKQIADELLTQMHGESVALYAFTSQLLPQVPLTLDYLFLRLMLRQININAEETAGTDILKILKELRSKYWEGVNPLDKVLTLVIFSDGGDTAWESLTGEDKSTRLQDIVDTVRGVPGLQVIAVGLGSQAGGDVPHVLANERPVRSSLETQLLQALTAEDGQLILANATSAFETSREISTQFTRYIENQNIARSAVVTSRSVKRPPESLYHFPLSLAIFCLVAALLMPDREMTRSAL